MEQDVMLAATANSAVSGLELDEETQKEFIHIIKSSLKGQNLTNRQANMLFFWARHQNAPAFNFVPAKYRAVEPVSASKKTAKKGK